MSASALLIGSLDPAEYARWRTLLAPYLPSGIALVAPDDPISAHDIEIALAANPQPGDLAAYPNLRFVQSLWAGVDRLLADPKLPPDVLVARLVDPDLTQAMVEGVLAHVFALHRQAPDYARQQAHREWRQRPQPLAHERAVTVLGLGELGSAVAQALSSFGFAVSGWSRSSHHVPGVRCFSGGSDLGVAVADADIVVNLLPLSPETTGILGCELFGRMKVGASVVNVARGAHVVEADLLDALADGMIDHAILDAFNEEPLPPDHPFWSHNRITVLPHVAAYSDPRTAAPLVGANVRAFLEGRPMAGLVDRTRGY